MADKKFTNDELGLFHKIEVDIKNNSEEYKEAGLGTGIFAWIFLLVRRLADTKILVCKDQVKS